MELFASERRRFMLASMVSLHDKARLICASSTDLSFDDEKRVDKSRLEHEREGETSDCAGRNPVERENEKTRRSTSMSVLSVGFVSFAPDLSACKSRSTADADEMESSADDSSVLFIERLG